MSRLRSIRSRRWSSDGTPDGTKLVLTGDATQIDNPYLDSSSNGLSYLVERMKGQPLVGHITLEKSERSELASLVTEQL